MEEHPHTSSPMDNSPSNHSTSNSSDSEEPKDLSMNHLQQQSKTAKKWKPIPPPLDLSQSSQILSDCGTKPPNSGGSCASPHTKQKNLPFRKRAHCSTLSSHSPSLSPLKEPLDSPPSSSSSTELWRTHLISSSSSSDLSYHNQYSPQRNASAGAHSPALITTSAGSSKSSGGLMSCVKQETPSDLSSGVGSHHMSLPHHPSSPYPAKSPHELPSVGYFTNSTNSDVKPPDLSLRHSQSMSTILESHHSIQRNISYMNQLSPLWYQTSALLSPAPSSLGSSREELSWNLPWPPPVWHCFMSGTLIQIPHPRHPSSPVQWLLVDDLAHSGIVFDWPGRLRIKQLISNPSSDTHTIVFSTCEGELVAQCRSSHMFYDKDRGWSCLCPDTASKLYGGGVHKYRPLQVNDQVVPVQSSCPPKQQLPVLSPPAHVLSPDLCDRMKRFSFPVSDEQPSPSFLPPTSLHPHHPPSLFAFPILSPPTTPTHKELTPGGGGDKPKRPMNAFMLFAKRYRLELIQNNPGKDNRAISVLLGEAWKSLPQDEKDVYVNEAKTLAQEQKMLHPDCWKRKRSHSTS